MTDNLIISVEGGVGTIMLDRPKAINALTRDMIDGIHAALTRFENDPEIKGILLEGAGTRGFCSGGDVRLARQHILDDETDRMDAFFKAEYALDGAIAKCTKPLAVLADKLVMGGGLGLAGHATFRFSTERTKFSMPEAAIGLVCDCGIDALLAKIPRHRALAFLLTGTLVGSADGLELGFTDCIIPNENLEIVREKILDAISQNDISTAMKQVILSEQIASGEAEFIQNADVCEAAFLQDSAEKIVAFLEKLAKENSVAAEFHEILASRCPTSLSAITISHDKVRGHNDTEKSLHADLILVTWMSRRNDFIEGVRAVLVDKDQNPKWQPESIKSVDEREIYAQLDNIS